MGLPLSSRARRPAEAELVPAFEIIYALALPDWQPHEATPFQGFAPGLINFVPLMEFIPTLPADILEPTLNWDDRLARRRAGAGAWLWSPVNLSTLIAKRQPTLSQPFVVIFSADEDTTKSVANWRRGLRLRPIHVSLYRCGGALHPTQLNQETLRQRLIQLARRAAEVNKKVDIKQHLEALAMWKENVRRSSSLALHSHNVTRPNEMVLAAAGEDPPQNVDGHLNASEPEDYVRGITESAAAVMELWPQTAGRPAYFLNPPRPDIFLLAPSMYRGISKTLERAIASPQIKSALRALDRQRGYRMELNLGEEHINTVGPVLALRGAEMKLTTTAVGLRTAGTLAATLRLPPAVDRTGGVVGQLARFLRTHENPPPTKSARVFKAVQDALSAAIPDEHLALISHSKHGIKIIAESPLEWLPVDGLPLGIRFDVSRIDPTPGNLFLQQIRPPVPLYIPADAFRDYLVLSMFAEGDKIAHHLRMGAMHTMDGSNETIVGRFAEPKTPEEFAAAIASFHGPLLIVDSHAEHQEGNGPGGLIIDGKPFDVWSLVGKVSMPPIVVLSACDTHPFDRSHATVANGFLACGAVAVVATALPIRARQAARFVMRLINRAVHYADLLNGMGRAVPWTHIVGGVLRMEVATDIIRTFQRQGHYDQDAGSDMLLNTNLDLNPLRPDWYERLVERVSAACSLEPAEWDRRLADIIAASDAIRYLHLGNPESIVIADRRVSEHALKQADLP